MVFPYLVDIIPTLIAWAWDWLFVPPRRRTEHVCGGWGVSCVKMKSQMIGAMAHIAPAAADLDGLSPVDMKEETCGPPFLGRLFPLFIWLVSFGVGLNSAQETCVHGDVNLMPPPTGEALTLVPRNVPDIGCEVLKWNNQPSAPRLAILCPPQSIFAPLHVYLKLSWLKPEDVPSCAHEIATQARSLTKIRTNQSATWVWLDVRERGGVASHKIWVAFNAVEDVALLSQRPKR